jgi:hypothetical protein
MQQLTTSRNPDTRPSAKQLLERLNKLLDKRSRIPSIELECTSAKGQITTTTASTQRSLQALIDDFGTISFISLAAPYVVVIV